MKEKQYNEYKKYSNWIKEIMIYLFMNRKQLAKEFAEKDFESGKLKRIRFGKLPVDNMFDVKEEDYPVFEVIIME
jgi:hypothetical protein